jgi:ribosomal protein S8
MIIFIIGFSLIRTLNLVINVLFSTASSLKGNILSKESSKSKTNSSILSVLARSGFIAHTEIGRAGLNGISLKKTLRPDKGQKIDF